MDSLKIGDIVLVRDRHPYYNQYFKFKVVKIELAYWQPSPNVFFPPPKSGSYLPDWSEKDKYVEFVNEVCWSKRFRIYLSDGSVKTDDDIFPIEPMF